MGVTIKGKALAKTSAYDDHLGATPPMKSKQAAGTVHVEKVKTHPGGAKDSKTLQDDNVTVHPGLITDGTSVYISGGQTISTAPFESVKITIGVTVPCKKDELNEIFEFASDWVSEKMTEAVKNIKG